MGKYRTAITTYVNGIECDGNDENCCAYITEEKEQLSVVVEQLAFPAGWLCLADGTWVCPVCAENRKDKTP